MNSGEVFKIQSSEKIVVNPQSRLGWTNDVLICQKNNVTEFFLPCYLRTKLKNIVSLDSETGKGSINIVLILSLYYGEIEKIIPDFLQRIQGSIVLRFKIDPSMQLSKGFSKFKDVNGNQRSNYVQIKVDQTKKLITYSIRRILIVPLISHVFWSPFEYIKYVSTISIESFDIDRQNERFKISFNLMDLNQHFDKYTVVSYTEQGTLGEYNLARSLIEAQFTNERFYSKDNQEQLKNRIMKKAKRKQKKYSIDQDQTQILQRDLNKIKSFKYGHSVYPVYRHPLVPYVSLFLPIVMLGFLNLGIFFQDNLESGKKIVNIAALLVSYIAFLPTIREKLPPSNSLVISQILLFSMAGLTILCLAHTIKVRNIQQYEFQWGNQSLYLATFIITLIIVGVLVLISIAFLCVFYRKFNVKQERSERKFDRKQWMNKKCDNYFDKLNQYGMKIEPISQYTRKLNNSNNSINSLHRDERSDQQTIVSKIKRKFLSQYI